MTTGTKKHYPSSMQFFVKACAAMTLQQLLKTTKKCYWQKKLSSKTLKNQYYFLTSKCRTDTKYLMGFFSPYMHTCFFFFLFAGLIVATLAICWMPNQVRRIMAAAKPKQDWTVPYFRAYITLLPIADSFFYLSSVLNPLLYNISSQQFRSVFLQVLRCRLTIEHANKEKFLRANLSSSTRSSRSLRPLLFLSSRRSSSTRGNNKVFLSTFQKETKSDCSPEKPPEPSLEVVPLETSAEPSPDTQNGLCEHQV